MKKLLSFRTLTALFLIVSMLLTLLCSCDEDKEEEKTSDGNAESCTEHIDSDSNGKCDNCDADVANENAPSDKENDEQNKLPEGGDPGSILTNSVIAQLNAANSVKFDILMDIFVIEEYWDFDYDFATDNFIPAKYTEYVEGTITLTTTVAKTSTGINAKMDFTATGRDSADAELQTDQFTAMYLVDGIVYTYDEELDAYIKSPVDDSVNTEEIEAMLQDVLEKINLTENDKNVIFKSLGDLAISAFNIKENKGSISIDVKPIIDSVSEYVNGIDTSTKTIKDILNDILALTGDDSVNTDLILNGLERIAGLTVNEAIAEIDAGLTASSGTTLQGLYDSIVNNPEFVSALKETLKSDLSTAEIDAMIARMQSAKIADIITQYGIGDVTVYDLITSLIPTDEDVNIPTADVFFESFRLTLAMTLDEFEEASGLSVFSTLKQIIAELKVNELNAALDLNFKGIFNIEKIEGTFNFDVEAKLPSEYVTTETDAFDYDITISFKLYDISKETVTITVPTDKEILDSSEW